MRTRSILVLPLAGLVLTACGGVTVTTHPQGAPACTAGDIKALPAIPTPPPLGTVAVRVSVANMGDYPCTITGAPHVAIGGLSPQPRNLVVTPSGPADQVVLAPGDQAVTTIASPMGTDFTCAAGTAPTRPPVLLVGVPQDLVAMKMADGTNFTECGDAVTVSPWQAL
ncbi:MAG TPA: DUF4232 domain-containing protein [Kutzneria sp.]|jgi:hypothetical protein|nr:DUF4232 domain-containing protein [Kutzneria sp.]